MPSVLAIISKAVFDKAHGHAAPGTVLRIDAYDSKHATLSALGEGGDLYLVTVRPGDVLWLVAVLRSPTFFGERWAAAPNTAPITDASSILGELRFASGKAVPAATGKLGMSLQTPRVLADADVRLLEQRLGGFFLAAARERVLLRDILELEDSFAIEKFVDFPEKNYPASGAIQKALEKKTGCASMLVIAGCMLWVARRLERVIDPSRCYQAAEALFCYQASASYFGRWQELPESRTAAERAVRAISGSLWSVYTRIPGSHSCWPPADTAGEAVTITRAVLGPSGKKPFEAWLKVVLQRIERVASNHQYRVGTVSAFESRTAYKEQVAINVGPPLPPELLRLGEEVKPETLSDLYAQFLAGVDWQANPFLAPPSTMLEKGFVGTPYQIGPLTYSVARAVPSREPPPAPTIASPYPFLRSLEGLTEAEHEAAVRAYVAERRKPEMFGPEELKLDHAFSSMLGCPVSAQGGTYVGILEASMDVIGDLATVVDDTRPRPAALRAFEHEIETRKGTAVREVLLGAVDAGVLDARVGAAPGELIAIREGHALIGRVTREELGEVAEELSDLVVAVRMIAPSDGTLFDALRYMLQQEATPWGMTEILDASDMTVESLDARMEAAIEAIEDRDLADALAPFCDTYGRCARAWQWKGRDRKGLKFVAGIYDGEGVGMEFNIYRVEST